MIRNRKAPVALTGASDYDRPAEADAWWGL